MNETMLVMVLLGPPALFGITVAIDDWRAERRYRRERAYRRDAQNRHPSSGPIGPEDRADWGQR
jgi:hypothetical protein